MARLLRAIEARPSRSAFALGAIVPLAYAPFFVLPLFFIAYGLMMRLALLHSATPWRLARLGWLFGFGQFFVGLLWMGEAFLVEADRFLWALPFAVTLLPAGLGLFSGAAFGLWGWLMTRPQDGESGIFRRVGLRHAARVQQFIGLAVLLALAAYLRSTVLTGLPWNLPGMVFGSWLVSAQAVALLGLHGLSFLALLSAALLTDWVLAGRPFTAPRRLVLAFIIPAVLVAFGVARLWASPVPPVDAAPVDAASIDAPHVAVIQPNIAQREKWLADKLEAHIEKTLAITRLALDYAPHTDVVIWPEVAIPAFIDESEGFGERLRAAIKPHNGKTPYVLTGAVRRDFAAAGTARAGGAAFYNSAMLWSGQGHLLGRSDKHHLVPFGEYLPLQSTLEALGLEQLARLRGGYQAGPPHGRLRAARLPLIAPLICYEVIFPHLSAGAPRPALLANLTNDGWFGQWHGPHQHLAQARLRAIEQGVPLIRAANTGISAAFDAHGRQLDRLDLGTAGSFSLPLPPSLPPTVYSRWGDGLFWLALLMAAAVSLWPVRRG